jgi:hypothetical protein
MDEWRHASGQSHTVGNPLQTCVRYPNERGMRRGPEKTYHTASEERGLIGTMRELRRLLPAPCRLLLPRYYILQLGSCGPVWPVELKDTPRTRSRRCG